MLGTALKAVAVLVLSHALGATVNAQPSASPYKGEQVIQVLGADTSAKVNTLEQNVQEVFIRLYSKGGMTARVKPQQAAKLSELGFDVKVLIADLSEHVGAAMVDNDEGAAFRAANVTDPEDIYFTRYHDYLRIEAYLDELMAWNMSKNVKKEWMQKKVIGRSLEQRPIWTIEVGNPSAPEAVFIMGGVHAREWITITSLQYIVREYVRMYASGEHAELFDQFRFSFAPVTNPDGYRHSYLHERLWRKNRRVTYNATCFGVNINRNFNAYNSWQFEPDPCSTNNAGLHPYSEPETKALLRYVTKLKSKHRLLLAVDVHSYQQSIMYPPGYAEGLPDAPNKDNLVECGDEMAAAIEKTTGRVYVVKNIVQLYPAPGNFADYLYENILSGPWPNNTGLTYGVEMRPDDNDPMGFILPPDNILPGGQEMLAGFTAAVEYARRAVNQE